MAVACSTVVACVGDNCIDRYLPPLGLSLVGGSCANVAVGLAEAGLSAAYVGAVGDDEEGERVVSTLAARGVDVSHVSRDPARATALTEIELVPGGERRFVSEQYAIHDAYEPGEQAWTFLSSARHIHASRLPRRLDALRELGWAGVTVSYDFSEPRNPGSLAGLDVAFASASALDAAGALRLVRDLVRRGARCAVATLGSAGSVAAERDETVAVPARPLAAVVDTCGAGDAFIAAFLAARLAGKALATCIAAGTAAGARACGFVGAFAQTLPPSVEPAGTRR